MATVLVDAENVRRSTWPNIERRELEALCDRWAERNGHEVVVVWEAAEPADDQIARDARLVPKPVWVVTSDRALRDRVRSEAEQLLGGGSFARELQRQGP